VKHSQGPFDWSHAFDGAGGRCDAVPVLSAITRYWTCLVCGEQVMTDAAAEANGFLVTNAHGRRVFRQPPAPRPPSIPGFTWNGSSYERIATPEPPRKLNAAQTAADAAYRAPPVRAVFVRALILVLAFAGALSLCSP